MDGQSRILILDDDENICLALQDVLEMEGYAVHVTQRGEAVLGIAITWQPHVVMLDLMMLPPNGWQVAQMLRACALTDNIPLVVTSAIRNARHEAEKIGTKYVVPKPFNMESAIDEVGRALRDAANAATEMMAAFRPAS